MRWFRVPARSLFLVNLAGAALAGLGVETLRTRMTDPNTWRVFARRFARVAVVVVGLLFLIQVGRVPEGTCRTGRATGRGIEHCHG